MTLFNTRYSGSRFERIDLMWIIILLFFSELLFAQITITNATFPVVGDTLRLAIDNSPVGIVPFTPPGPDQVWDYSSLQADATQNIIYRLASHGSQGSNVPGAELFAALSPGTETYFNVTSTSFESQAYWGIQPFDLVANNLSEYLPPLTERRAPINFFDVNSSSSGFFEFFPPSAFPPSLMINLTLLTSNAPIDSMRYRVTINEISAADGYGMMSIPGGTYDVLREKRTRFTETRIDAKVPPLGWLDFTDICLQAGFSGLGVDTTVTFYFHNEVSKEHIAVVRLNNEQNAVTMAVFKANGTSCPPGNILYVNANAAGANNGTSWNDAFTNLQDALNSSCPGITQIWVATGTYTPGTARSDAFVMKNNLAIYGGFPNTGDPGFGDRNADPATNGTVLSGEIGGAGITDNSYTVVIGSGTDSTAILDGFTITAGNADGSTIFPLPDSRGGGMYNFAGSPMVTNCLFTENTALFGGGIYNADASPTITNCSFIDNQQTFNGFGGGGIMTERNSSPTITQCRFENNHGRSGGGLYFDGTLLTLTDCVFTGNTASLSGGGLFQRSGTQASLSNCTILNNSAQGFGGGINSFGSMTVIDCIIDGNQAANAGGVFLADGILEMTNTIVSNNQTTFQGSGINIQDSPGSILTNCLIIDNASENSNGGIANYNFFSGLSVLTLVNSTVANNTSVAPYTAMWSSGTNPTTNLKNTIVGNNIGGNFYADEGSTLSDFVSLGNNLDSDGSSTFVDGTNGNIVGFDPLFVSAGNYRLQACSPAIDAGTANGAPNNDLDGNTRPVNAAPNRPGDYDMGAYEFQGTVPGPTLVCTDNLTVQLDANLTATVTAAQIGSSSDGCAPLSFLIDGESSLTFDCDQLGSQTVTLQVIDQFMNVGTTTCSFTVADPLNACCIDPEVTNVVASAGVCPGDPATITVTGSLNSATEWVLYSDECGGNVLDTSTDGIFQVPDVAATYYVRAEGGCVSYETDSPLIWEEQFNGEIPATWALSSSPAGAVWAWSANGDPYTVTLNGTVYTASYYPPNFGTIGSPSAANGSAMFNADAYSTNGTFDTTGGPFPGAHTSSMTSPSVDCSGQSSVFVRFYQYTRLFQQATITLSVSTDDGGTWTDFTVANNFFFDNLATTIDISSVASNQADVKLRFTWSSNTDMSFYFGIIDDVQLRSSLDDASGAIGCTEVIVVPAEDNTAPSLACTDLEVTLGTDGTYQITSADLLTATGASDACGILGYTLSTQNFVLTCDNVGTTPVTITVEDNNGLTAACTVNQIVTDGGNCNQPPVAVCQPVTVNVDVNCEAAVATEAFDGGSTDPDMDPLTFSVSPAGPYALGTTNVTLTVSDGMAMSQCMTTVTVEDNTPPTIACFNQTLNFNGELSIPLDENDLVEATDNCGVQSISLSPNSISSNQVGQTVPVAVTVTDENGNSETCTSQITVTGLPSGWSQNANGVGCADGNNIEYNASNATWTATSTNCFYTPPYTSDATAFAQYSLCGNGSITAQVTGISGTSLGWAGVTMRETNAPGAKKAQLTTNMSNFSRREFRTTTNGAAFPQQFPSQNRRWLRIVRSGNQFVMYVSPNGVNWAFAGAQTIQMTSCIEIGLVVTNYSSNSTVTATFANVSVLDSNQPAMANSGDLASFDFIEGRQSVRDVKIFPNPTSGQLNIALTGYEGRPVTLEVYNTMGQMLYMKEVEEVQNADEIIDLSAVASGMYLIRVSSDGLPAEMKRVTVAR